MILLVQGVFWHLYLGIYIFFTRGIVGYFEEEAVISYTEYLAEVDAELNVEAPRIAIEYWGLGEGARLRDVIVAVREDERGHSEVNHGYAD